MDGPHNDSGISTDTRMLKLWQEPPIELPEIYVAVDVKADGPIPGPDSYSMLSLGMAVVGDPSQRFYTELRPISVCYDPQWLEVSGLDRDRLLREAPSPEETMAKAANWINDLRDAGDPVLLAADSVSHGMFVHWYFLRFLGKSPFPPASCVDLRSYWMALTESEWFESTKGMIKHLVGITGVRQTPHAGNDAAELAEIFGALLRLQQVRD